MLRCYHLPSSKDSNATLLFLQTLTGQQETVSSKNEASVRKSLVDVSEAVEKRSKEDLAHLESVVSAAPEGEDVGDCRQNAIAMLRNICQLEAAIARGVKASVKAGVVF